MSDELKVALAQLNVLVGDVEGNAQKIIEVINRARDLTQADLVVFPELTLSGYPPEDLLLRASFMRRVHRALDDVATAVSGIDVIIGVPVEEGGYLFNSALLMRAGQVVARYDKQILPNYKVFDDKRYFQAGTSACVVDIKGVAVGITICEDIWQPQPAQQAVAAGAGLLININASPYHLGKHQRRVNELRARTQETGLPIIYVNYVGGQDELVYDGDSLVMAADGQLSFRAPDFEEGLYCVTYSPQRGEFATSEKSGQGSSDASSLYRALVLGVHDYVTKNSFRGAVLGLSGGIDSALTLAIAVDALGGENVEAVLMPSRYTAQMSIDDAREEADALGVVHQLISIEPMFDVFLAALAEPFSGLPADTTEENIQARIRGIILMAFSNKKRRMLLTTGNKSEMAVGYATLYGDMAGGFAPLKDVSKTWVYRLAEYRNTLGRVIPERVITRPPSAELAPEQKDSDSLPLYDVLDPILELFVEQDCSASEIIARGYDAATVRRIAKMVLTNEYKRRQAPPGVRITQRGFGKDRRYPITSGYGKIFES